MFIAIYSVYVVFFVSYLLCCIYCIIFTYYVIFVILYSLRYIYYVVFIIYIYYFVFIILYLLYYSYYIVFIMLYLSVCVQNWTDEAIQRAHSIIAAKSDELNSELELRLHLHAPRARRAELDVHNVRAGELSPSLYKVTVVFLHLWLQFWLFQV